MKQKVQPQGILDILTPGEFTDIMQRHNDVLLQALGRNARFNRYIEQDVVGVGGALNFPISPPDGFLWELRGIIPSTSTGQTTEQVNAYYNQAIGSNLIEILTCNQGLVTLPGKTVILHSSDNLLFGQATANGPAAGVIVTMQLLVVEVPNSHEAQLLL